MGDDVVIQDQQASDNGGLVADDGNGQDPTPDGGTIDTQGADGGEPQDDPMPPVEDPNSIKAWMGRREARLRKEITSEYDQKLSNFQNELITGIMPLLQQQQQNQYQQPIQQQEPQTQDEPDFINDPLNTFNRLAKNFVSQELPRIESEQNMARATKAKQVLSGIEMLAKNDPHLKDDVEKVMELARSVNIPNFDNLDPMVATRMAFMEVKNNTLTERLNKKVNPLANNKPINQPVGSIAPSPGNPAKPKPNISNEVIAEGLKMGFKDVDEIYKYLGEG